MKNFTRLLLLASIVLLLFGYDVSAQKPGRPKYLLEKRGFKTLKLGDPIEKHEEYVLITEDHKMGSSKMYTVMLDKNPTFATIGDSIKIDNIVLEVYNGIITSISIFVKDNKDAFLSSLQAAYGLGDKLSSYSKSYFWYARNRKDNIELTYLYDYPVKGPNYRDAWAIFQDKNLLDQKERDIEKKAKQNINNL